MYKYNKNDNMTKELVWFSGQCFPGSLERLGFESWLLQFACNIIWGGLVSSPMGLGSSPSQNASRINKKYR